MTMFHFKGMTIFFFRLNLLMTCNIHYVLMSHCPAFNMHFSDYGINDCTPSYQIKTPGELAEAIKSAKCVGWGNWQLLPLIGCSSPEPKEGVKINYPCLCDFEAQCSVRCDVGYRLVGNPFITCQKDGTYTKFPDCIPLKCDVPILTNVLRFDGHCSYHEGEPCKVTCIDEGYGIEGSPLIICKDNKWDSFPICRRLCQLENIPDYLSVNSRCTGNEGELCPVNCTIETLTLIGEPNVKCSSSGDWTQVPRCGCSRDSLPSEIVLSATCTLMADTSCSAMCQPSHYPDVGTRKVVCSADGSWNLKESIKCLKLCSEPNVPDNVEVIGICDARRGQVCRVKCRFKNEKRSGKGFFQCLKNGQYSAMPGCAEAGHCPKNLLPENVKFTGECTHVYGETCSVGCSDPSYMLEGMPSVTCSSTGAWDALPKCVGYCEDFKLNPNMELDGPCSKRVGESCNLKCKTGFALNKGPSIKCTLNRHWEEMPECVAICLEPPLSEYMIVIGQCTKHVGSVCKLGCQTVQYTVTPTDEITCLEGAVWSPIPTCRKKCDITSIPDDMKLEECSEMFVGDECAITCLKPNEKVFGPTEAVCKEDGIDIDHHTKCDTGCKVLVFPIEIRPLDKPIDCNFMDPGQNCKVKCKNERATLIGPHEVTCLGNNEFSEFPQCDVLCSAPILHPNSHILDHCETKANSKCIVVCDDPNYSIKGKAEFEITCRNAKWTKVPPCLLMCDEPILGNSVMFHGNCKKAEGSICKVVCKEKKAIMEGSNTIKCENQGWMNMGATCVRRCDAPHLPKNLLFVPGDKCLRKVDTQCKVRCKDPFIIVGGDFISCSSLGSWSVFPICVSQ